MPVDSILIILVLLVVVGNQTVIGYLLYRLLNQPAPQPQAPPPSRLNPRPYEEQAQLVPERGTAKVGRKKPEVPLPDPAALIKKTTTTGFGSRANSSEEKDAE